MTAQEAQNILKIEPPFSTVELKSAHKNAIVAWFPAQFMSDRAKLSQALEQTARVHEAYEVLQAHCEKEREEAANPWVEEAMKLAYGKGGDKPSAKSVSEAGTPAAWDPLPSEEPAPAKVESSAPAALRVPEAPPRAEIPIVPVPVHSAEPELTREPVEKATAIPAAPIQTMPASSEAGAAPATLATDATPAAAANPAPAAPAEAEHPRETGRVPTAWRTETTHATKPTTISGSVVTLESASTPAANPFLHEVGPLKVVSLKPVDTPKVELRDAAPAQVPTSTPSPAPPPAALATAPVALPVPQSSPDAGTGSTVLPRTDPAITQVRPPKVVISPRLRRTPILSPPPAPPEPEPAPVPAPVSAPVAESPAPGPLVVETPVEKPKPVAQDTSAAHAEEAAAAAQASHHAPVPVATPATTTAVTPSAPTAVAKPAPALGAIAPPDVSVSADADAELAGDHALVPALGDRYHPAEKEAGPSTDSSRHLPTRPFAPSGMTDKDNAEVAAATRAAHSAHSARASQPAGRTLSVGQRLLRFLLAIVCIGGVAYGIYWVSQSKIGKDPWGSEPGSGGPGERVKILAFESMTRAAERGNADAQLAVAKAYRQGKDVAENPEE
ncbi:MAG TPA: hypothetical protein VLE43_10475, partial [Candidatus Saccharimonadia bacterium]|nr:hypothetical protein [Candidatus Saccharimonadia bacterium]